MLNAYMIAFSVMAGIIAGAAMVLLFTVLRITEMEKRMESSILSAVSLMEMAMNLSNFSPDGTLPSKISGSPHSGGRALHPMFETREQTDARIAEKMEGE